MRIKTKVIAFRLRVPRNVTRDPRSWLEVVNSKWGMWPISVLDRLFILSRLVFEEVLLWHEIKAFVIGLSNTLLNKAPSRIRVEKRRRF